MAGLYAGDIPIHRLRTGVFSENGIDTSDTNITADDIPNGKIAYGSNGKLIGTMPVNEPREVMLHSGNLASSIPSGKHDDGGRVYIVPQTVNVQSTKESQTVYPTSGNVITQVNVDPIPSQYVDTSDGDALDNEIEVEKVAYVNGQRVVGTLGRSSLLTVVGEHEVDTETEFSFIGNNNKKRIVLETSKFRTRIPKNLFGNAETSDVTKGVLFTSANGLSIEGTREESTGGITPSGTIDITENGVHDVTNYASANVNVASSGDDTSDATVTSNAHILAPYTAYANGVKYTGSIPTKTDTDITVTNNSVSIPSGYYADTVTKNVATVTQATPSISVDSATGKITASSVQSAGYVVSGTKSATHNLTVQAAKTVNPTTAEQTVVLAGVYTTGAIKVAGMTRGTLNAPTVDASGVVTSSVGKSGYISVATTTTMNLPTASGMTVTENQTLSLNGKYMLGDIVINVPVGVDIPDGNEVLY